MVNEEVPRESLALGAATPYLRMAVVVEGREASVSTKRHVKSSKDTLAG